MREPAPQSLPPPPPALARAAALVLSGVLALSVPPVLYITLIRGDAVLWFSSIFETLVLTAAIFGIASGLGRFANGWALSLACVAGTVLVCGVFAFLEIRANFADEPGVAGLLTPYLGFRLALAAAIAATASVAVFSRNRACWIALLKGILVLIPPVGITAWYVVTGGGFLGAARPTPGGEAARLILLTLGGLILVGFVSVGGHLLIRAYELGRPDEAPGPARKPSPSA